LLRSIYASIIGRDLNKELAGFPGIQGARTDGATEERMIQLQLQPEIEAQLVAEAQARGRRSTITSR
jgi:hypothetical protein